MPVGTLPVSPVDEQVWSYQGVVRRYNAELGAWDLDLPAMQSGGGGGGNVEPLLVGPATDSLLEDVPVPLVQFPAQDDENIFQYMEVYGNVANGNYSGTPGAEHFVRRSLVYAGIDGFGCMVWETGGTMDAMPTIWTSGLPLRAQFRWHPLMTAVPTLKIVTSNGLAYFAGDTGANYDELTWTGQSSTTGDVSANMKIGRAVPFVGAWLRYGPWEYDGGIHAERYEWYVGESSSKWRRIDELPGHSLTVGRRVVVTGNGTPTENGNGLRSALGNHIPSMLPAVSPTAICTVVVEPGAYDLGNSSIDLASLPGVVVVGSTGNPKDVLIYSSNASQTLRIGSHNALRGVSVGHIGSAVTVDGAYNSTTTAVAMRVVLTYGGPYSSIGADVEDVILFGNEGRIFGRSANYPLIGRFRRVQAMAAVVAGYGGETWRPFAHHMSIGPTCVFEDCRAGNLSFGAYAPNPGVDGVFNRCTAGDSSFGYEAKYIKVTAEFRECIGGSGFASSVIAGASSLGKFTSCKAGEGSWSREILSGTHVDCVAGDSSFAGCAGTFVRCTAGGSSFTNTTAPLSGVYQWCFAGDLSFSVTADFDITGEFYHCEAGAQSFSLSGEGAAISGTFAYCKAGDASFTASGATATVTGKFYDCTAGSYSFAAGGAAEGSLFIRCHGTDGCFAGNTGNTGFDGTAMDCSGNVGCFGTSGGGIGSAARILRCTAATGSFGASGVVAGLLEDCEATGLFSYASDGGVMLGTLRRCKAVDNIFCAGGTLGGRLERCVVHWDYTDGALTTVALFVECEMSFNIPTLGSDTWWPRVVDADTEEVTLARLDRCLVNSDNFQVQSVDHPEYQALDNLNSLMKLDMHDCRAMSATDFHKQAAAGPGIPQRVRIGDGELISQELLYY